MPSSPDSTRSERARNAFATALEKLDRGEPIDFEKLFHEQPELELELRSMHANWRDLERVFGGLATDVAGFEQAASDTRGIDERSQLDLDRLARPDRSTSRYERVEKIAEGGMGVVWRVYDRDMQRELALKSIRLPETPDGRLVRRFLSEARLSGRLDHPGILPVHDIGLDRSGELYFTMPLVRGTTLDRVLTHIHRGDGEWTLARAIEIVLRVCDAMDCAHAAGVIHRDLKPANIMVGRFGETYVMDWGLAREEIVSDERAIGVNDERTSGAAGQHASATSQHAACASGARAGVETEEHAAASAEVLGSAGADDSEKSARSAGIPNGRTLHGAVLGTPAYMAPEQARGSAVGPRADVYALGAILYHILTGRPPYARPGVHQSGDDVLRELRVSPPASIDTLAPQAAPELVAICAKAMARELDDRYSGVRAMSDDLRAFIEGRVVRAHQIGAWPELKKWVRRNRRLAIAISASIVVAIAGLSWVTYVEKRSNAEILRLSDVRRLTELERRAEELWPAVPEKISAMEHWLAEAHLLASNRDVHKEALRTLGSGDAAPPFSADSALIGEAWRRDVLSKLVADLDSFADTGGGQGTIASVERRLKFARAIGPASLEKHAEEWGATIASIADRRECPAYDGLSIVPQLGLVPIGRDPSSGLWEFAHLASGTPPERAPDGSLVLQPSSSLVFVLLPAGSSDMGSLLPTPGQPSNARADALADKNETPVRTVKLDAFFLSKFEMTLAQWHRVAETEQPSSDDGLFVEPLHPAASVSWTDARRVLGHVALMLPTEAQWEYGARAGTTTRWWCGNDASALVAAVNAGSGIDAELPYEDLHDEVARVDALAANPFGLHNVHGNAREWTLDAFTLTHALTLRAGDGLAEAADSGLRTVRGGGYASSIAAARSAARVGVPRENRNLEIGIRPARAVERH
jgi:serine/threonine protein kinase/formylglycine-generating enzyme required for sulfatase activity